MRPRKTATKRTTGAISQAYASRQRRLSGSERDKELNDKIMSQRWTKSKEFKR